MIYLMMIFTYTFLFKVKWSTFFYSYWQSIVITTSLQEALMEEKILLPYIYQLERCDCREQGNDPDCGMPRPDTVPEKRRLG